MAFSYFSLFHFSSRAWEGNHQHTHHGGRNRATLLPPRKTGTVRLLPEQNQHEHSQLTLQFQGLDKEKKDCHWCQLRAFPTHKTTPITVVNIVDDVVIPPKFRFINRIVLGKDVEAAEDSFRSGCSCGEDGAGCQFGGCQCLADLVDEDDSDEEEDGVAGDDTQGTREGQARAYSYHTHGVKAGKLRSKFLDSSLPLYECHQACSCSSTCPNRVVEGGRTVPLEIFRTTNRGWGKPSFSVLISRRYRY